MKPTIYMDYAATTPVKAEVISEMIPYFSNTFGNPSSTHAFGREAKKGLETARERVACALNADTDEIVFTSGGTESNNLAICGFIKPGEHIITSCVEHHSVLGACEALEKMGVEVTYLPVDGEGRVIVSQIETAVKPNTKLVSVMLANNEIGTIMPVAQIAAICKEKGILLHTDAVQAFGHIKTDVEALGADMLSVTAHKCYGPKGAGALYVRRDVKLRGILYGGLQEKKLRAGTENTACIVGLGKAAEMSGEDLESESPRLIALRDKLIEGVLEKFDNAVLTGSRAARLPGNANFTFEGVNHTALVMSLDLRGIAVSAGSACLAGAPEPSHVIKAIGRPDGGAIRVSLGALSVEYDVEYLLELLSELIPRLKK
jgi:cysteine desulfurase